MNRYAILLLAVLAFHYEGKDAAEAKQQYRQDIKTACTSYDYDTLKVGLSEAGADPETEGFVAFTYRSASKLTADQPEEQVRVVGLQAVCMFVYTLSAGASSIPCWLGYWPSMWRASRSLWWPLYKLCFVHARVAAAGSRKKKV